MKQRPFTIEGESYRTLKNLHKLDANNPDHLSVFRRSNIDLVLADKTPQDDPLHALPREEQAAALWDCFAALPEEMELMRLEDQPWIDFDDVWKPVYFQFYERETSGIRNDRYTEQVYIELEYMIEEVIAKPH